MSTVTLVSGGLDSTVLALLTQEEGISQFPLFIDYGQLGKQREFDACVRNLGLMGLPRPEVAALSGYGSLLKCGITDATKHIVRDAFLPGRNLLFLLVGAGYAFQCGATTVAIGLLDERQSLFPDQTSAFIADAQNILSKCLGRGIRVSAPLMSFTKADIVAIAKARGITRSYSCHAGTEKPCGVCIACREYDGLEV